MRQLWIVRHGKREDDEIPDWQVSAQFPFDPDLSPSGREQAEQTARRLASEPVEHLLSSPYLRTLHTSQHFSVALDLPIGIEPGLGEVLNAEWFPAAPRLHGPGHPPARELRCNMEYRCAEGPRYPETWDDHQKRCERVIDHVLTACPGSVVLVTHAASVYAFTRALTGRREEAVVAACSLTLLEGPPWRLALFADTAHLHAPG